MKELNERLHNLCVKAVEDLIDNHDDDNICIDFNDDGDQVIIDFDYAWAGLHLKAVPYQFFASQVIDLESARKKVDVIPSINFGVSRLDFEDEIVDNTLSTEECLLTAANRVSQFASVLGRSAFWIDINEKKTFADESDAFAWVAKWEVFLNG